MASIKGEATTGNLFYNLGLINYCTKDTTKVDYEGEMTAIIITTYKKSKASITASELYYQFTFLSVKTIILFCFKDLG